MELKMKISALNITNSIRNIYNETYQRFLRIRQMITQIWDRIIINATRQPKETFVSYIKDYDFTLVDTPNFIKCTIPDYVPKIDFDKIKREFVTIQFRDSSIENKESAVEDKKTVYSYIKPMIEKLQIRNEQLTSVIHEELKRVKKELNEVDEAQNKQAAFEVQSYEDHLKNLEKEKQEDLQHQITVLEEEFKISEQGISNFESLLETLTDKYIDSIVETTGTNNIQGIPNIIKNLAEQHKNSASSIAKESLENLRKDFEVRSLEIPKEIESKYNEKKESADIILQEKLKSLKENALKEKQRIKQLSDKKINSITSKIEDFFKDLITNLSSQIQEELARVSEELNEADKAKHEQAALEVQSYQDRLKSLKEEKQKDLQNQLKALEEEFNISKQSIFNFQSKTEALADEYIESIAEVNRKFNMQSTKLSNISKNLAEQRKKFAKLTAEESLQVLMKSFATTSLEIHKGIELKYIEKEKNALETLEENLTSLEQDRLKAKEIIKKLSDEKINSINLSIEDLRKNIIMTLSSEGSKNEEVATSFEITEESKSIEEDILPESEFITDSIEQSANSPEVIMEISLKEDRPEEKEMAPQDSLMTTIHKTYNLLYEGLLGTLVNPHSFHF